MAGRLPSGRMGMVIVYVDDLAIACEHEDDFKLIMSCLQKKLKVKHTGTIEREGGQVTFLGREIVRLPGEKCALCAPSRQLFGEDLRTMEPEAVTQWEKDPMPQCAIDSRPGIGWLTTPLWGGICTIQVDFRQDCLDESDAARPQTFCGVAWNCPSIADASRGKGIACPTSFPGDR